MAVLAAALPADAASLRKGPWVQHVTRTSAVVMFELDAAAPATVRLREVGARDAGEQRVVGSQAAVLHEVRITGLEPSRRYAFVVEVGGGRGPGEGAPGARGEGEIATAPLPHEAFSFVAWGDSRMGDEPHRALCERIALEAPDLILHTGDFVSTGGDTGGWQAFFDIERDLLRRVPLYPVVGNHDREGIFRRTEKYRTYFAVPDDAPNPERYYAFSWGNSRFVVLDSNEPTFSLAEQALWLDEQLAAAVADPEVRHIFVAMHHPLFSTSLHGPHEAARLAWAPLFERYRVDLVFAGHDHVYEHLERGGVRYVITGGGGAPLYFRHPNPRAEDAAASVAFDATHHFVRVQVAGDFVEVAAVRIDGELIESFSFGARPAGVCRADTDCDGLLHPGCPGAWRCEGQACEWRCGASSPITTPREPRVGAPARPRRPSVPSRGRAAWLGLLALGLGGAAVWAWRRRRPR